jgi:hypothetical protein
LRQTIKNGWLEKNNEGYKLTISGKNLAIQIDENKHTLAKSPRISVLLVLENNEYFLIQHRLSEPFKGVWEFPTARIPFGSNPKKFTEDFLQKETGLQAQLKLKGINHKIETKDNNIFDDKYYLVFVGKNFKGKLKPEFDGGKNCWLTKEELLNKEKTHIDLPNTFDILEGNQTMTHIEGEIKDY